VVLTDNSFAKGWKRLAKSWAITDICTYPIDGQVSRVLLNFGGLLGLASIYEYTFGAQLIQLDKK
jgi:hypothetical protein